MNLCGHRLDIVVLVIFRVGTAAFKLIQFLYNRTSPHSHAPHPMSLHVKDIQFPHLSEVLTPGLPTHGPPVVTITESDTYPKIPSTGTWTLCFSRSLFPWSLPWASSSLGFVPPLESQLQCPILLPLLLPFLASCLWFC